MNTDRRYEIRMHSNLSLRIVDPHDHLVRWLQNDTWIAGFEVKRREMPSPSNASLHEPSERVSHNPLDFPKALVCILDDAVSNGYRCWEKSATSKHYDCLNFISNIM